MQHVNPIDELAWRGLIAQSTDLNALRAALGTGTLTFYGGFDPTAPSLHLGHLVLILTMRRLQLAGHRPIALVGGATGLIGDPRPTTERGMQDQRVVADWVVRIRAQIAPFLLFGADAESLGVPPATMVNNLDWTADLTALDLLREIGKHFRLGTMLGRDVVARRLASDEGLSFTEFSYQVLQGLDFLELFRTRGCTLQVAGNDQWGNIVGGVDLIRKVEGTAVHALTTPLITRADGAKMGKSEGGAVSLDPEITSPYAFYQYLFNTTDADVVNYLKVYSFKDRSEIERLAQQVNERPQAREAQRALASELTTLVHGPTASEAVELASRALFGSGELARLDQPTLLAATAELPSTHVTVGTQVVDALVGANLAESRAAARRTVREGGAFVNNKRVSDEAEVFADADFLYGRYVLLRRGKRTLGVGVRDAT